MSIRPSIGQAVAAGGAFDRAIVVVLVAKGVRYAIDIEIALIIGALKTYGQVGLFTINGHRIGNAQHTECIVQYACVGFVGGGARAQAEIGSIGLAPGFFGHQGHIEKGGYAVIGDLAAVLDIAIIEFEAILLVGFEGLVIP